jgi:hypothetical protein
LDSSVQRAATVRLPLIATSRRGGAELTRFEGLHGQCR